MPITAADLQTAVYKAGNYAGDVNGPALHTTAGRQFNGEEMEHLQVANGRVSYNVVPDPTYAGVRRINFAAAGALDNAMYLPYRDNNICSVVLDATVDKFFTDTLSGCSIFIDRLPNNDLVLYHANVQGGRFKPTEEEARDVRFEKQNTVAAKKQLRNDARNQHPGAQRVASLYKNAYNERVSRFVNVNRFAGTDVLAVGTTVVGFREATGWDFWYQTWAMDANQNHSIQGCVRFAQGV